jgi:hypothetical protein
MYYKIEFDGAEPGIYQAKYAASAGIISHSKPLMRKNKNPATPKRFINFVMKLFSCSGTIFIK